LKLWILFVISKKTIYFYPQGSKPKLHVCMLNVWSNPKFDIIQKELSFSFFYLFLEHAWDDNNDDDDYDSYDCACTR